MYHRDYLPSISFWVKLPHYIINNLCQYDDYLNTKQIVFGLKKPINLVDKTIVEINSVFSHLLFNRANILQIINENNIANFGLTNENLINIKELLMHMDDSTTFIKLVEVFELLYSIDDLREKGIIFTIISFVISVKLDCFFVPMPSLLNDIKHAISKRDHMGLELYISNRFTQKHTLISQWQNKIEELKKQLSSNSIFLSNNYVKQIFGFGSVFDGTANSQSDIDLAIIYDSVCQNPMIIEKLNRSLMLFLEEKLQVKFDIHNYYNLAFETKKVKTVLLWSRQQ